MRIGLIAPPWVAVPPPGYGGTEMVVDLLARGLRDAGHEVLLAAAADSTCPVPLVPGTAPADPDAMNTTETALAHAVRAYGAMATMDLVHDHTLLGPLYRHRPAGVPVTVTNHGPFTDTTRTIFRAMAPEVAIVAISHDQASRAGDVPIARVIHHGLDVAAIPPGAGDGGYVCFLGRICPDKGVLEAIGIARAAGVPLRIAAKMRERSEHRFFEECVEPALGAGWSTWGRSPGSGSTSCWGAPSHS